MKRKQMRKLATEIAQCEIVRDNPESSKEEKTRSENRIIQISNLVMCLPDGFNVMSEIDIEVQRLLAEKQQN